MGRVIKAYRDAVGRLGPCRLSQTAVANWLDTSQANLSRIEKGKRPTDLKKLVRWARVLQIPQQYLWFALPDEHPKPPSPPSAVGHGLGKATPTSSAPWNCSVQLSPRGNSPGTVEGDLISSVVNATRKHAQRAELTEIGPSTVEQLRAELVALARAYVSTPSLPLFTGMNRVREQIFDALDRKTHPTQATELYLLAGAVCALMANACLDLGRCAAGDELARVAWTYGMIISHGGLMAWARGTQALAAILDARPYQAVQYVDDGLKYQRTGMAGARLYAMSARALATGTPRPGARGALAEAKRACEKTHPLDLSVMIGGEFSFGEAKQHYYAAVTYVSLGDARQAEAEADTAIRLFEEARPHDRSYGCEALARSQLALARLLGGELDGAEEALDPVFELAPEQRISSLVGYLETGRELLRRLSFQGSLKAMELDERLALFCTARETRELTSGWNEHST